MKITLGIGETKIVSIAGGRFYYENGLGKIYVKTMGNDSNVFELSPGMGFQNRDNQVNFPALEIVNLHTAEQDIEFIISYREVFDNRVSFDSLMVIGNEKALVKSGVCFQHPAVVNAPVDGTAAAVMLRAFDDVLYVRGVTVANSGLSYVSILDDAEDMEDDPSFVLVSHLALRGNADSDGAARNTPSNYWGTAFKWLAGMPLALGYVVGVIQTGSGNQMFEFKFARPLRISPGKALMVNRGVADAQLIVNFDYEVADE